MYKLALKNGFMFIGAMIGAGFATGAELMVFFSHADIASVVLSAILIGALSVVFVMFGRVMGKYARLNRIIDCIMLVSALITLVTMQAGIEELFGDNYGVWGMGLITAFGVAVMCRYSMNFTKIINLIIIPIIAILVVLIATAARPQVTLTGNFAPIKALSYAAMNLMLGGYLIAKDSRGMRGRHCGVMSLIISLVVGLMMCIMLWVSRMASGSSMPIYSVALHEGLGGAACAIIFCAIVTTMIGAGKVVAFNVTQSLGGRWWGSVMLILFAVVTYGANFDYMVNTFYPITGYVGLGICLAVLIVVVVEACKKPHKKLCGNHSALKTSHLTC